MRFLVDRCTGPSVAAVLRDAGHDVLDVSSIDPDPGDEALLELAVEERRVVVTMDRDFGTLVFRDRHRHAGLIRLPNVAIRDRRRLTQMLLNTHGHAIAAGSIITVTKDRVRVSANTKG
ncbi:MAG: DUF5615 family PIN-like protein [Planctomycetota bacterium]